MNTEELRLRSKAVEKVRELDMESQGELLMYLLGAMLREASAGYFWETVDASTKIFEGNKPRE